MKYIMELGYETLISSTQRRILVHYYNKEFNDKSKLYSIQDVF